MEQENMQQHTVVCIRCNSNSVSYSVWKGFCIHHNLYATFACVIGAEKVLCLEKWRSPINPHRLLTLLKGEVRIFYLSFKLWVIYNNAQWAATLKQQQELNVKHDKGSFYYYFICLFILRKGSYRILTHVASRENIPHTVRAATAQAISDELPEESTSSWSLRYTACHSPGWIVRFPLISALDVFLSAMWSRHGHWDRRGHSISAMLRMSVSLRKGATFRPGVHVRKGKSRRNPCRVAWKSGAIREWMMRASVADNLTCRRQERQRRAQAAHVMLSTALLHSHWRRAESNASATLTTHNIHFLL